MSDLSLPKWYLTAYKYLVVTVFCLIALGGATRIMRAGLACPDWPLCFGDLIPDFQPQVYFEFIHRVLAGSVTIVTVLLQLLIFRSRVGARLKWLAGGSLFLLATQIVFGGLTVLLLLQAGVVATHLILGTGFFITLLWIYLSLRDGEALPRTKVGPTWLAAFCLFVALAVYSQILLGGLVASNFASLVCIDWPTCHGQWFPTFSGIIGLHIIHRLGAYFIFALVLVNAYIMRRFALSARLKALSRWMVVCVFCQLALGIANVLLLTPPLIALAHLATGVLILSLAFRQLHVVRGLFRGQGSRASKHSAKAWPSEFVRPTP